MKDDTAKIKAQLLQKRATSSIHSSALLSTSATVLDLSLSGKPKGGIPKGQYLLIVGDSGAGKTWIGRSILAEASINPRFKDYLLIHDDVENGAIMDTAQFFGPELAKRLQPPKGTQDNPIFSEVVEDFYYTLDDLHDAGRPFVYVLDSESALESRDDQTQHLKEKKAYRKGQEADGSYGMGKPKFHSKNLRRVVNQLKKTGSILVIISQTRKRIGFGSQFNPKTRAGGDALKFYAHQEVWTSIRQKIKKEIKGKKRTIGVLLECRIEKNRVSGREGRCEVPIYYSFGIDNIGSCIDYLIEEKHWECKNGVIKADEFDLSLKRDVLIKWIETNNKEKELKTAVTAVFQEIEEESRVQRKSRYH